MKRIRKFSKADTSNTLYYIERNTKVSKQTFFSYRLTEYTIEHAKLMAQAISFDGKFDVKVSTFGASNGILIHVEKCGVKSLNRKHKD